MLGVNALAAKAELGSAEVFGSKIISKIDTKLVEKTEVSPIISQITPAINKEASDVSVFGYATSNNNLISKAATNSMVSPAVLVQAEDVIAGTFGAHSNNGDYVFPAKLTVNGQMFLNDKVGIGLTNPEAKLHVYDSNGMTPLEISSIPNHTEPMIKLKGYNSMDWMWIDSNSIDNVFIGVEAGLNTVGQPAAGRKDIFIGHQAGYANMFAMSNIAIGDKAFYNGGINYASSNNVALGDSAGYSTTGSGNVFLGHQAGYNETGSNKLYIANSNSDTLIYGDFAGDKVGINTINPDATLRVNGSMKANNYYSANGNVGLTKVVKLRSTYNQPCTMSFENGLMIATTCPTQ